MAIRGISDIAAARITDSVAARIDARSNGETLLRQWRAGLPKPAPTDLLTHEVLDRMQAAGGRRSRTRVRDVGHAAALRTAPTDREIEASVRVGDHRRLARHAAFVSLTDIAQGVQEFEISRGDARRLRLDVAGVSGRSRARARHARGRARVRVAHPRAGAPASDRDPVRRVRAHRRTAARDGRAIDATRGPQRRRRAWRRSRARPSSDDPFAEAGARADQRARAAPRAEARPAHHGACAHPWAAQGRHRSDPVVAARRNGSTTCASSR